MKVLCPASSANIGPGFDCFGIAWRCYNTIEFLPAEELRISGCEERFRNEQNLAYTAYCETMKLAGKAPAGIEINFLETNIPVSRGMGSSSSLVVAGAIAANELNGLALTETDLLNICTAIEGHPDNVAPALIGGLTASAMDGDKPVTRHFAVNDRLYFTVLIPDFELLTSLARSVLPKELPRADAIFNVSRAAFLLKAIETGDCELLHYALDDRIHQPYRIGLIPGFETARRLSVQNGAAGICISGAGSTLLCITDNPKFTACMAADMREALPAWKVMAVRPDFHGARVLG